MSAIKSMNNCVRGYLHLDDEAGIINYYIDDNNSFEGNAKKYINELEFENPDKFDLDDQWDNFVEKFFNANESFYKHCERWIDLAEEFNSKEMIWLLKEVNKYWLETLDDNLKLEEINEEQIWNCIAYYWIRERSDNTKFFVLKKIQEKFDEWLEEQKDDGDYPLSCDICYRNKQIETYAACCKDKKFCGGCYKKLKGKLCPFCRGEIDHAVGDDEVCNKTGFQDWLFKMNKIKPYIEKKKIVVRRKQDVVVETPFQVWRRKMNYVEGQLLYKMGEE